MALSLSTALFFTMLVPCMMIMIIMVMIMIDIVGADPYQRVKDAVLLLWRRAPKNFSLG